MSAVFRPMRAAAMAASQPAWPAPTTATSYCSVNAIQVYFTDSARGSSLGLIVDLIGAALQRDGLGIVFPEAHAEGNTRRKVVNVDFSNGPGRPSAKEAVAAFAVGAVETDGDGTAVLGDFDGKALPEASAAGALAGASGGVSPPGERPIAMIRERPAWRIHVDLEDAGRGGLKIGVERLNGAGNATIDRHRRRIRAGAWRRRREAHKSHLAGQRVIGVAGESGHESSVVELHAAGAFRLRFGALRQSQRGDSLAGIDNQIDRTMRSCAGETVGQAAAGRSTEAVHLAGRLQSEELLRPRHPAGIGGLD